MEKGYETEIPYLCSFLGRIYWDKTHFSQKEFPIGTGVLVSPHHIAPWVDRC